MESPAEAPERHGEPITAELPESHGQNEPREASPVLFVATPPKETGFRVARSTAWSGFAVVVAALAVWGQPLTMAGLCLALAGMAATALAARANPDRTGIVGALPAGFVVVGAWAVMLGLLGGLDGLSAWSSRWTSGVGLVGFVVLTGLVSIRRGGCVVVVGADRTAFVGFLSLSAFWVWVIAVQPFEIWARINDSGTDFLRHLASVSAVEQQGSLAFGGSAYPQGLQALGAWITSLMNIPNGAEPLWKAVAPLGLLMTGLILLAIMSTAERLMNRIQMRSQLAVIAAAVAGVAFAQTAWFSTYLAFGNLMNMMVGICLLALLVTGQERGAFGSTTGSIVGASALALTANAWQLLIPVVGVAALPWIVAFLRQGRRRAQDWVIWIAGGVCALNGVLGLRAQENVALASVPTVSNLFRPDWWWWAATALAILAILVALRRGFRAWAVMTLGALVAAAVLVAGLLVVTGSSWELIRYYPAKALWTSLVVVIPLAATGGVWGLAAIWDRAGAARPTVTTVVRGALALLVGVCVIGVVGRGAAFPPHLVKIAEGRSGFPNWQMALVDSMGTVEVPASQAVGAVVFGLVPSASTSAVQSGYVGMVDYMAMESLRFLGIEGAADAPVKPGLYSRDMTQVCRYLKDHPDSLRITGPNPAAGAPWIIDSGCPTDIVRPERWISLDIDPVWLERSPWEDGQWIFPTFDEVRQTSLQG
jgi:hypothetical protein